LAEVLAGRRSELILEQSAWDDFLALPGR